MQINTITSYRNWFRTSHYLMSLFSCWNHTTTAWTDCCDPSFFFLVFFSPSFSAFCVIHLLLNWGRRKKNQQCQLSVMLSYLACNRSKCLIRAKSDPLQDCDKLVVVTLGSRNDVCRCSLSTNAKLAYIVCFYMRSPMTNMGTSAAPAPHRLQTGAELVINETIYGLRSIKTIHSISSIVL